MSDTPSWPTGDGSNDDAAAEVPTTPSAPPPDAPAAIPPPAPSAMPPPAAPSAIPPPPPPAAPAAPAAPATPGTAGATLGLRFGARLIDSVLIGILGGVLSLGLDTLLASIASTIIAMGYYVTMETTRGATVGKMLLGLSVAGADGEHPDAEASFKRNAWVALQIVPVIGALAGLAAAIYIAVTINSSPDHRGYHDDMAGTTVTKA